MSSKHEDLGREIARLKRERDELKRSVARAGEAKEQRIGIVDDADVGPGHPPAKTPPAAETSPNRVGWLRQHYEGGRLLVVACVVEEEGDCSVSLFAEGGALQPGTNCNPSREVAFGVGDTLVRIQFPHDCGRSCSDWVDDADGADR